MSSQYANLLRSQSRPLEPKPSGEVPVLRELPGIRAVLFDVYGTLFISASGEVGTTKRAACQTAMAGALRAMEIGDDRPASQGVECLFEAIETSHAESRAAGVDHPEVDIVQIWGRVLDELAGRGLIEPAAAGTVDLQRLAVEYEARANPCWPMPHLRGCLESIRGRGLLLGIISNAQFYTYELFNALLDTTPDARGFDPDLQFYSYQHGRAKPGTALYELAVEALRQKQIGCHEVLFVGNDMLNDVLPASRVGFRTALFAGDARSLRRRQGEPQIEGISPDLVVTDLRQILARIIVERSP